MKILIVTPNVGRTAPGIVFERLIFGLLSNKDINIDLLVEDYEPSLDLSSIKRVVVINKIIKNRGISNRLIKWFGFDLFDHIWSAKAKRLITSNKEISYDIVLSFMSFQHYSGLIAGQKIAKKIKAKFAVLSVDAVPAPLEWGVNYRLHKNVSKLMQKYLSSADAYFTSNEKMLEYQLSTFKHKNSLITGVIYNPSFGNKMEFPIHDTEEYKFLYTGGIYGARKSIYLLNAFELLLDCYPNSKLVFVGTTLSPSSLSHLKPITISNIEIHPFTKELTKFYKEATALIDIDADFENDVFLSSKITNYILINRIIISETGKNSPSRSIFKNINSIIQCDHDSEQIKSAMIKSIKKREHLNVEDRNAVIQLFNIENISYLLLEKLRLSVLIIKKLC